MNKLLESELDQECVVSEEGRERNLRKTPEKIPSTGFSRSFEDLYKLLEKFSAREECS